MNMNVSEPAAAANPNPAPVAAPVLPSLGDLAYLAGVDEGRRQGFSEAAALCDATATAHNLALFGREGKQAKTARLLATTIKGWL